MAPYTYCAGHSYFDKKLHGSAEVVVVRQRDSVAKRHRTECDTIVTPRKRPEWRAAWGETPPGYGARGAPLKMVC